jgi:hypothetical protein
MRRTRLVLYVAAFLAWTVAMVLGALSERDAARIAVGVALAVTALAAVTGTAHGAVTAMRGWRAEGFPTWRGRR